MYKRQTLGSALIGLVAPDSGSVRLDGRELVGMTPRDFRPYRRQIQMVFQLSLIHI